MRYWSSPHLFFISLFISVTLLGLCRILLFLKCTFLFALQKWSYRVTEQIHAGVRCLSSPARWNEAVTAGRWLDNSATSSLLSNAFNCYFIIRQNVQPCKGGVIWLWGYTWATGSHSWYHVVKTLLSIIFFMTLKISMLWRHIWWFYRPTPLYGILVSKTLSPFLPQTLTWVSELKLFPSAV